MFIISCDNIQSVTYTAPTSFDDNPLWLISGTYAIVRPDVPLKMKGEATDLLNESFSTLIGKCYINEPMLSALEIPLNLGKLNEDDLQQIKFVQPDLDYIIYLQSDYKEPVVTEFQDSRYYRSPNEHVTGTLYIIDLAKNEIAYKQALIGSTEERYDPYDEDDDEVVFKATGELLAIKVLKRLIGRVEKNAIKKGFVCD